MLTRSSSSGLLGYLSDTHSSEVLRLWIPFPTITAQHNIIPTTAGVLRGQIWWYYATVRVLGIVFMHKTRLCVRDKSSVANTLYGVRSKKQAGSAKEATCIIKSSEQAKGCVREVIQVLGSRI